MQPRSISAGLSCDRRSMLQGAAATAGLAVIGGVVDTAGAADVPPRKKTRRYTNADFYAEGKFQVDKARAAYFEMMQRFRYPVFEMLKEQMWIADFGLGDFVRVGMAGVFWLNRQEYGYFGHEIYLLPGQMIVEHAHVATDKAPAKMESWQVRHGMVFTFGEGEPTPGLVKLPKSQEKFITVRHGQPLYPGEVRDLNRLEAKHFMIAGPEGAIVTEYATFHDNDGLRFTNPGVAF